MSILIFFILFAIVVCIVGLIVTLISYLNKKKNCTLIIPGTIINIRPEDYRVSSMDDYGTIVYRPIVNYQYNGQTYTYYHNIAKTSYKNLSVGTVVNIRINPNNPQEAILKI